MKFKHNRLMLLLLTSWLVSSCTEEEINPQITVYEGAKIVSNLESKSTTLEFDCNTTWSISNPSGALSISPMSGGKGAQHVTIKAAAANCSNDTLSTTLTITAVAEQQTTEKKLTYKVPPLFEIESEIYKVGASGGEVKFYFNTEIETKDVNIYADSVFSIMCNTRADTDTHQGFSYYGTITVKENLSSEERIGCFCLVDRQNLQDRHSITGYFHQEGNAKSSSDFSRDGEVVRLQRHSQGKGFPIVLMGDGFLDSDIEDNTYDEVMTSTAEQLFTIEPMATLRSYFDVWYVTAVSQTNSFSANSKTAFNSKFTSTTSSEITGDNGTATKYAQKTGLTNEQLDNTLVLIILNSKRYGGTCNLYYQEPRNNCPVGISIAYIPMVDEKLYGVAMETVLHHEAVGHGLAKLNDEYGTQQDYLKNGNITDDAEELSQLKTEQSKYLFFLNTSLESDPSMTPWATFYGDARYADEQLGTYEGASGYPYGIYRPTDNSLMNTGETLDAFGRSKVYQRVMNVANDFNWTFDYETYVDFDQRIRQQSSARQSQNRNGGNASALPPLSRPVVIEGRPGSHTTR